MDAAELAAALRRAAMLEEQPKVEGALLFRAADMLENDQRHLSVLQAEADRLRANLLAYEDAVGTGELVRGPGHKNQGLSPAVADRKEV